MRLLMHVFAIIGLLGMTTNLASKVLQSHPPPGLKMTDSDIPASP
jgi:hypothetical protein